MSEATARATRREIRRAIGPQGLAAVNGVALKVHQELAPTVAEHESALKQHNHELDSHDRQLTAVFERLDRLEADAKALQAMTFMQRLRWAMQALF